MILEKEEKERSVLRVEEQSNREIDIIDLFFYYLDKAPHSISDEGLHALISYKNRKEYRQAECFQRNKYQESLNPQQKERGDVKPQQTEERAQIEDLVYRKEAFTCLHFYPHPLTGLIG